MTTLNNHLMITQDQKLMTPLHVAAANGKFFAVQTLLENGANISAVDAEGNTPIHWAAISGFDDVLEEFLSSQENMLMINLPNLLGFT